MQMLVMIGKRRADWLYFPAIDTKKSEIAAMALADISKVKMHKKIPEADASGKLF